MSTATSQHTATSTARATSAPAADLAGRMRREASDYLDALGVTPKSRAKLGLDLARTTDLATAMSEPNDERRAELLREAGVEADE